MPPTPLEPLPLDLGRQILAKREDVGPNRAFKWRGALAACETYRRAGAQGITTASTGNHGAAVAWAASRLGLAAHVFVPHGAVSAKCELIAQNGGTLHYAGVDITEAGRQAAQLAEQEGIPYFEDGASEAQLAGAGTVARELRIVEGLAAIFVPVASGALAAGIAAELRTQNTQPRLIGVQSIHFSRMTAAYHERPYQATGKPSFADGLADDRIVEPAWTACLAALDDLIAVDDDALADAVRLLSLAVGIRAEGAGAAALAGLLGYRERLPAGPIVVIVSGGNLDAKLGRQLLRNPTSRAPHG